MSLAGAESIQETIAWINERKLEFLRVVDLCDQLLNEKLTWESDYNAVLQRATAAETELNIYRAKASLSGMEGASLLSNDAEENGAVTETLLYEVKQEVHDDIPTDSNDTMLQSDTKNGDHIYSEQEAAPACDGEMGESSDAAMCNMGSGVTLYYVGNIAGVEEVSCEQLTSAVSLAQIETKQKERTRPLAAAPQVFSFQRFNNLLIATPATVVGSPAITREVQPTSATPVTVTVSMDASNNIHSRTNSNPGTPGSPTESLTPLAPSSGFTCEDCGGICKDVTQAVIIGQPKGKDKVLCRLCARNYSKSLRRETGKYRCTFCLRSYKTRRNMEDHVRIHTGERPFVCNACGEAFYSAAARLNHITAVHTPDERPFKCDYCDKRYIDQLSLERHVVTHIREKPYPCDYCGKAFAHLSSTVRHMRSCHRKGSQFSTNVYNCDYCEGRFTDESMRERHIETMHRDRLPYKCSEHHCSRAFKNILSYELHLQRFHHKKSKKAGGGGGGSAGANNSALEEEDIEDSEVEAVEEEEENEGLMIPKEEMESGDEDIKPMPVSSK